MPKRKKSPRKLKPIPRFKNEDEERAFWATHDSTDYLDWNKAVWVTFPNLKPTTTTISIRLPVMLLEELKTLANKRDVPYQSLMKVYLAERVAAEHGAGAYPRGKAFAVAERARVPYRARPRARTRQ